MGMRVCRSTWAVAFVALWLATGCGSSSNVRPGPGLEGSYTGTYRLVDGATVDEGALSIVIGADGRLSGAATSNTTAQVATLTGSVRYDGLFTGSLVDGTGDFRVQGKLGLTTGSRLVGVLARTTAAGSSAGDFSVDCVPTD